MLRLRAAIVVSILLYATGMSFAAVRAQQGDTYGVSASIIFCDREPGPDEYDLLCGDAFDGTSISVRSEDGPVGSCRTESVRTPWGGTMNMCGIDGAPFHTTLTFTVDESTLPVGYILEENDLAIAVGDLIPGGGDQTTVTFRAFRSTSEPENVPSGPLGYFADIVSGSCEAPGPSATVLNAVETERGPHVGSAMGVGPETSESVVSIALDTLIDEPHAVSIYGVNERAGDRILCGDIGGVDNDDGTIHVVLYSMDSSLSAAGLAQLSYGDDPAIETVVRLFVIPLDYSGLQND